MKTAICSNTAYRNAAFHKSSVLYMVAENAYHMHILVPVAHFHCVKMTHVKKGTFGLPNLGN